MIVPELVVLASFQFEYRGKNSTLSKKLGSLRFPFKTEKMREG